MHCKSGRQSFAHELAVHIEAGFAVAVDDGQMRPAGQGRSGDQHCGCALRRTLHDVDAVAPGGQTHQRVACAEEHVAFARRDDVMLARLVEPAGGGFRRHDAQVDVRLDPHRHGERVGQVRVRPEWLRGKGLASTIFTPSRERDWTGRQGAGVRRHDEDRLRRVQMQRQSQAPVVRGIDRHRRMRRRSPRPTTPADVRRRGRSDDVLVAPLAVGHEIDVAIIEFTMQPDNGSVGVAAGEFEIRRESICRNTSGSGVFANTRPLPQAAPSLPAHSSSAVRWNCFSALLPPCRVRLKIGFGPMRIIPCADEFVELVQQLRRHALRVHPAATAPGSSRLREARCGRRWIFTRCSSTSALTRS